MEPRAHHLLVGLFVLASAAALVAFALWLGKAGGKGERIPFRIVFEGGVQGLSRGSPVLYSGLAVGEVTRLWLDRADPSKVWVEVALDPDTPVRTTTTARLAIANITGASVILLENEDPDAPPLPRPEGQIPQIPSRPSPFAELRNTGEQLLYNVSRLVDNALAVLSEENAAQLSGILADLRAVSNELAGRRETLGRSLEELAGAAGELRATLGESHRLLAAFNERFAGQGEALFDDAGRALAEVAALAAQLRALLAANRASLTAGAEGLARLGPALERLEALLAQLEAASQELRESPGNFLLRGETIEEYAP